MKERDGFASGFFAGAIFGSVVGGILGALIANGRDQEILTQELPSSEPKKVPTPKRRQMKATEPGAMDMEMARRSLEDKIAQLNATIDEVRQQLGDVNGNSSQAINENPSLRDELRKTDER